MSTPKFIRRRIPASLIPIGREIDYCIAGKPGSDARFYSQGGSRSHPLLFLYKTGEPHTGWQIGAANRYGEIYNRPGLRIIPDSWETGLPIDPPDSPPRPLGPTAIDLTLPVGLLVEEDQPLRAVFNPNYQQSTHRITAMTRNEFGVLATSWYNADTGKWISGNDSGRGRLVNK